MRKLEAHPAPAHRARKGQQGFNSDGLTHVSESPFLPSALGPSLTVVKVWSGSRVTIDKERPLLPERVGEAAREPEK